MFAGPDDLLLAYSNKRLVRFRRSRHYESSWFGGPAQSYPTGIEHGPRRLHHVATISRWMLEQIGVSGISQWPLFYGFTFDGCRLSYRVPKLHSVELLSLNQTESSGEFPYCDYPTYLPYCRMATTGPEHADMRMMLHQHIEVERHQVVILLPCLFTLGMSLWGAAGDGMEVQVVFVVDPEEKTVRCENMCD